MAKKEKKMITVYGEILQETDKAILVRCDDESDGAWLPKSQVKYDGERGDTDVEIQIPALLAEEKGFFDGMGRSGVESDQAEEPVALDAEDLERGASTIPNDRHFLREETITVSQELTQKEQAEYAEEMAALDGEIQELEDERDCVSKSLKKLIDGKEDKRRALSKIVREGKEQREITCDLTADYNTCEMVWTDTYPPHEEVQRRKMTEEERQLPLEMKDKPEVQAETSDNEVLAFFGVRNFEEDTESDIYFDVHYGDEEHTVVDFLIPRSYIVNEGEDGEYPEEDNRRYIEISKAHAVELGIIDEQEEEESTRSCATCAHIDAPPAEGEADPCAECGGDDLPNWQGRGVEDSIPGVVDGVSADAAEVQ